MTTNLIVGTILSAILFSVAYIKKTLTLSAAITAVIMMMCICLCSSYKEAVFLMVSYVLLVVIDIKGKNAIEAKTKDVHDKTGARRTSQVLANGLFATIATVLFALTDNIVFDYLYFICVAEACADSIASDVGVLSKKKPRSILTFKQVETGMSGGVSLLGILSSLAGCIFMGAIASLLCGFTIKLCLFLILTPFIGMIFDSVLGASIQAKYRCKVCGKATEKASHCNEKTVCVGGIGFVTNSFVNVATNLFTAILSYIIWRIIL